MLEQIVSVFKVPLCPYFIMFLDATVNFYLILYLGLDKGSYNRTLFYLFLVLLCSGSYPESEFTLRDYSTKNGLAFSIS